MEGDLSPKAQWSVSDMVPPCLAFWFESTASVRDGLVHFAFLTWLGLQSKMNRSIFREDILERGPAECYSRFWCQSKCHVDFFQKAKMTSGPEAV